MNFSKFFPRLQKFLTQNPCYTAEKKKLTVDLKSNSDFQETLLGLNPNLFLNAILKFERLL